VQLLQARRPDRLLADKAYFNRTTRAHLRRRRPAIEMIMTVKDRGNP
jgi:hypothetical protein